MNSRSHDEEALHILRHSTAHLMAHAVMELYPGTIHEFIERTTESAGVISRKIIYTMIGREPISED